MIRVTRPSKPPSILADRGQKAKRAHCDDYDHSPHEHRTGERTFAFDSAVYNAGSVKGALLKAQHGKCCYCEAKISPVAFGDVEHYRPKAGCCQRPGDPLVRPGYYWLAYEWSNLLMACQVCNQQCKKNLFPLEDPTRRANSHHDDIGQEKPLLIDPATDDPSEAIGFREEYAYAIADNPSGRETIEILKLNDRLALVEARRARLTSIQLLKVSRDQLANYIDQGHGSREHEEHLKKLDKQLAECVDDSAEYAAMARAALESLTGKVTAPPGRGVRRRNRAGKRGRRT